MTEDLDSVNFKLSDARSPAAYVHLLKRNMQLAVLDVKSIFLTFCWTAVVSSLKM